MKHWYYTNPMKLKAQIIELDNGQFCLHRYSYPSKVMRSEHIDARMAQTFDEAKAMLDDIYRGDFAMTEVDEEAFLKTFEIEETPKAPYDYFKISKARTETFCAAYDNHIYVFDFYGDKDSLEAWISRIGCGRKLLLERDNRHKHLSLTVDMEEFVKEIMWELPDHVEFYEADTAAIEKLFEDGGEYEYEDE